MTITTSVAIKVYFHLLALILSDIVLNSGFHSLENIGRYLIVYKEEGIILFALTNLCFSKTLKTQGNNKRQEGVWVESESNTIPFPCHSDMQLSMQQEEAIHNTNRQANRIRFSPPPPPRDR